MRSLQPLALSLLLLSAPALAAAHPDKHSSKKHGHTKVVQETRAVRSGDTYFTPTRVQVIREYYGPRYRALPPGLQKKLYRTGSLPPGWQKRFQPFPVLVERRLGPLPREYRRGVIDNYAVVYDPRRDVIVDVVPLR